MLHEDAGILVKVEKMPKGKSWISKKREKKKKKKKGFQLKFNSFDPIYTEQKISFPNFTTSQKNLRKWQEIKRKRGEKKNLILGIDFSLLLIN